MRDMYRLCATERLFIPDMFPDMEKAIFMDTDLIFLRCSMCVVGDGWVGTISKYNFSQASGGPLGIF